MAVDLPEVHARSLDATRAFVAGVGDGQWGDGRRLRRLDRARARQPLVSGNYWADELAGGKTIDEVGDRLDGDVLGDDPSLPTTRRPVVAAAAFRAPGAMDAPCAVSYGPVPGSIYCGHRFIDVLIHGWDVAQVDRAGHHAPARPRRGVLGGARAAGRAARGERHVRHGAAGAPRRRRPDAAARGARPPSAEPVASSRHGSGDHRHRACRCVAVGAHVRPQPLAHRHGDRALLGARAGGGRRSRPRRAGRPAVRRWGRPRHGVLERRVGRGPARAVGRARAEGRRARSSTSSATTATTPAGRRTRSAPSASSPCPPSSSPPDPGDVEPVAPDRFECEVRRAFGYDAVMVSLYVPVAPPPRKSHGQKVVATTT